MFLASQFSIQNVAGTDILAKYKIIEVIQKALGSIRDSAAEREAHIFQHLMQALRDINMRYFFHLGGLQKIQI